MRILLLIVTISSAISCYKISKENNRNVPLWTISAIFFGFLPLILLLIIVPTDKNHEVILTKKKGIKRKKEIALIIIFLTIGIGVYMYFKPTYMQKTYCGNIVKKGEIIKKNVPITIRYSLNKDIHHHEKINETMELDLFNKKYFVNILHEPSRNNDYHGIFPLNNYDGLPERSDKSFLGSNTLNISKNFDCVTIEFNHLDDIYSDYTISSTSNKKFVK